MKAERKHTSHEICEATVIKSVQSSFATTLTAILALCLSLMQGAKSGRNFDQYPGTRGSVRADASEVPVLKAKYGPTVRSTTPGTI
eukprot:108644-Rhodomonas_salina.2